MSCSEASCGWTVAAAAVVEVPVSCCCCTFAVEACIFVDARNSVSCSSTAYVEGITALAACIFVDARKAVFCFTDAEEVAL
mmetsp:Transcript_30079/g.58775  ORF Transcript_30079/g.58775 Transcript_30079/m.58775 type:complete len:81 (-) Transcript_30079:583-825(-)